jgi:rare lipoprotein A
MTASARRSLGRTSALAIIVGSAVAVTGCTSSAPSGKLSRSKEYFAESEYGVKASPRVSNLRTRLPRGGGRDMVGKPYKVKGKWYKPQEDRDYRKVGAASWYGDAFHGRLTANGEIYDMTHLTAAHPTMPLPSYARVTNLANGSSVVVRVNDRGPYAEGRIIDLSKRAAEMLDYSHAGVARVKVEYVGRAPLDGRDDQYLLASYRPGKGGRVSPIDDGLPAGVMVAMNGPTPSARAPAPAFPVARVSVGFPSAPSQPRLDPTPPFAVADAGPAAVADNAVQAISLVSAGNPVLPIWGPPVPDRPVGRGVQMAALGPMSYADERIDTATRAFAALDRSGLTPEAVLASWKRLNGKGDRAVSEAAVEYVAAGTFLKKADAAALAARLSAFGKVAVEADGGTWSVTLSSDGRNDVDRLARLAWDNGAPDAFMVRN